MKGRESVPRVRRRTALALVAAVAMTATAVLGSGASAATQHAQANLVTVKVAAGPYLDYAPWVVARDLGIGKQFGLDLKVQTLASPQVTIAALRRGDIDVGYSCQACDFPLLKQVPDLRDWMITNQFKGFAVIGRTGALTYAKALNGSSPRSARKKVLDSFRGKSVVLVAANFQALLDGALSEVGINPKDVKILNFADDAKAALAFEGGTGDYYMGSLPQETKLLQDSPDRFVNVGGSQILGPGGLWYSTMVSMKDWLAKNQDTALRLMATWYRTMKYLHDRPKTMIPKLTAAINQSAAAKFTPKTVSFLVENLLSFSTVKQAAANTFNPASDVYNRRSVQHYAKGNAKVLPANYNADTYFVDGVWFKKLEARGDLMRLINRPLG